MAKMIPDTYIKETPPGEKVIFDTLKKSKNTNNWIVLHSLNLADHPDKKEGQTDFVFLLPNFGICIIEIKSSKSFKIKYGKWYEGNKFKSMNESPFQQAKGNKYAIQKFLINIDKSFKPVIFTHGVIFTNWSENLPSSPEYKDCQYLNKKKLYDNTSSVLEKNLINFIIKIFEEERESMPFKYNPNLERFNNELQVLALKSLRPNYESFISPKNRRKQKDDDIKAFTEEQYHYLDENLPYNPRIIIQGPAGTGKTVLAIETAIRASNDKKKVFLTCYNKLFGEWLYEQVKDDENITCKRFIKYLMEVVKISQFSQSKKEFFSQLPNKVYEYLNKNPLKEEEKFDELIIDEAQDICRIDFFLIFDKILKGGLKKGKIRMFGDFKEQQILPDRKSFKSILNKFGIHDFAEVLISTNCRNREQVGKRVANYCEIKSPYKKFLRDGGQAPQPRFFSNKEDEIKEIHKVLDELRKEKFFFEEIQFLTFDYKKIKYWRNLFNKNNLEKKFNVRNKKFIIESVARYKGLDNKIIIVLDADSFMDKNKPIYYIALTRALERVYLIVDRKLKDFFLKKA